MRRIYILLILSAVMLGHLSAVPVNPHSVIKIQLDGTEITVRIKGDERIHWMESSDGYTPMYNNKQASEKAEFSLQIKGLYLLCATDDKGCVSTQKIIIK